jgi:siroheme synthase (precorrin-2 oxidase/ferrochelatase)
MNIIYYRKMEQKYMVCILREAIESVMNAEGKHMTNMNKQNRARIMALIETGGKLEKYKDKILEKAKQITEEIQQWKNLKKTKKDTLESIFS